MGKKSLSLLIAISIGFGIPAKASNPTPDPELSDLQSDSIPTYDLQELEVEAPRVIRKADMDVYHPSASAIELSSNGLQTLTYLNIPSLLVDDVMGKISANGENVQIRINGRVASVDQVRNIIPSTIKRVEWLDNPGLRYNGANYVLNIIVSNPSSGGSLMLAAQPMLNVVFGNYNFDLKINQGRSQWSIGTYFKPVTTKKVHRDYYETFTYPDGLHVTRTETPLGGKVNNTQGRHSISYSYIKPDTTVFYAQLFTWNNYNNLARYEGRLSISNGSEDLILLNQNGDKNYNPTVSLYLEQHLPKNQMLVADFSASLLTGHSFSDYMESYPGANSYITDIHTYIKDFNQAYGAEVDYIKNWDNSKLTAGINYSANINRSTYRNLDNAVFRQTQDKVYFFGEYLRKIGKVTLQGGIGAQYTSSLIKETGQGNDSWNVRPQATLSYSINQFHQLRLNFTSWQTTPSLSETNIAPQQIDGFQWNIGNPDLKTYNTYKLSLRYGFNFWRVTGNFNAEVQSSPKAITPFLYWDEDKLITSYENSKRYQSLGISLSPQIQVIPDWLVLSGTIRYLAQRNQGSGYRLHHSNWSGDLQAVAMHWNFSLTVIYGKAARTLWGEKIMWGEDMSAIILTYNYKNWQFGALMFMPFSNYDQGSKMISKWNTNEYHLRLDFRMVGLLINYNLQWGKQKRSVNKLVDSEVSIDKSAAKSR